MAATQGQGPSKKRGAPDVLLLVFSALELSSALTWGHQAGIYASVVGLAWGLTRLVQRFASSSPQALQHQVRQQLQQQPAPVRRRGGAAAACAAVRWTLTIYIMLLVLVRVSSPDPMVKSFPAACPESKLQGCSRVAEVHPHRPGIATPVRTRASPSAVEAAVLGWLQQQPRMTVLYQAGAAGSAKGGASGAAAGDGERGGFVHARAITAFWGFADDVFVSWRCSSSTSLGPGEVVVEAQGQLRIGIKDLDVNVARNAVLLAAVQDALAGAPPSSDCNGTSAE